MTQSKHTPGPWVVETWSKFNGEQVTQVSAFSEDGNRAMQAIVNSGNNEANARLIAESPTMHDLLLKLQAVRSPRELHNLRCEVVEVLARIEGV